MTPEHIALILLVVFLLCNMLAFYLVGSDKRKALQERTSRRTSEGVLFFWAACFGAVGVYVAMLLFRHKTKRWYFQVGVPLLMVQNLATMCLLWTTLFA